MQFFRNMVHGWFGKVVLGVVIALFVVVGSEALLGLTQTQPAVVEVNKDELNPELLQRLVENEKRNLLQRNAGYLTPDMIDDNLLRSRVAENWVNQRLLAQTLDHWGVMVPKSILDETIVQNPRFQVDGAFDQTVLTRFLKAQGYSAKELYTELNQSLALDALVTGLQSALFVTPKEQALYHQLQAQTRTFRVTHVKSQDLKSDIQVSEKEIQAFYDEHTNQYMQPEAVAFEYVYIQSDQFKVKASEISESALLGRYETYKQSLKQQQERKPAHILVSFDDRSESEAKQLAEEIRQKIDAGEDFAELAKTYSDDKPSAEEGGALPQSGRGTFVPEFETTLFDLALNEISQPVKTDFGYHIIRLDAIEDKTPDTFDEKLADLKEEAVKAQQNETFQNTLDEIGQLAFESANLEAIATAHQLTVKSSGLKAKNELKAPLNDPQVIQLAFDQSFINEKRNSEIIELADGALVLHPLDYRKQAPKPFDTIKDQVKDDLIAKEAKILAAKNGRALLANLRNGSYTPSAEQALVWEAFKGVNRRNAQAHPKVIRKTFAMAKPQEQPVFEGVELEDGFVVIELQSVETKPVDMASIDDETKANQSQLANELKDLRTNRLLDLFLKELRQGADIYYSPSLVKDETAS